MIRLTNLQPPPEYKERAEAVVRNAAEIHEFINRCEACGLPVADRRAKLNGQVEFAQNYIQQFHSDEA